MPRKPSGVVVSAVLLSIFSVLLLLSGLLTAVTGMMFKSNPNLAGPSPGAAAAPSGMVLGVILAASFLYLAMAMWGILTSVGLFRMKPWSRVSIMIIGGCLAALGLLMTGAFAMMPTLMRSQPLPPGASPAMLSTVFGVMAFISFVIAGVGIWWVAYFALRRTRDAFAPVLLPMFDAQPVADATPFTDYSVARPALEIPTGDPAAATTTQPLQGWPSAPVAPAIPTARYFVPQTTAVVRPAGRPVSMLILGILMLIGSIAAAVQLASPLPLFLFGMILKGAAAHFVIALYAILLAYCGLGLIKLQKAAWFTTFGLYSLGAVNALAMLLPAYRARMVDYILSIMKTTQAAMPQPIGPQPAGTPNFALDPHFFSSMMVLGAIFGLAFIVFLLVLLHRARWAFEPKRAPDTAAQD